MNVTRKVVSSFLAAVSFAAVAHSDQVTFTTNVGPIAIGSSASVTLPQFDPSLGVLRAIEASSLALVSGTWGVENPGASPVTVGGYASGSYVGALVQANFPGGANLGLNPAFLPEPVVLSAFDGTVDWAGTSGTTWTFTNQAGDGAPSQTVPILGDAQLPLFVGSGTVTVVVAPLYVFEGPLPPGVQSTASLTVNAVVSVRYLFDSGTTRVCMANVTSGCPCGNYGYLGRGCGNSVGFQGGELVVAGSSSIAADTLVLQGNWMTNSNALYFQGTSFQYAQTIYGDGLRCVGGSIVRLGTKVNVAGSSQYPGALDPSVSARGGVLVPGTRYYQVIYRDGAAFCTSSQFNATNGFAVSWSL